MGDIDAAWLGLLFGMTGIGAALSAVLNVIRKGTGGLR